MPELQDELQVDGSCTQFERAVEAIKMRKMSIRKAATSFGVSKSALQQRTSGQVAVNAKCGPLPILTEGEVACVLQSVDARTKRGQCFTTPELGLFVRRVVEESPYRREIPLLVPFVLVAGQVHQQQQEALRPQKGPSLETCRAIAATEENVRAHYNDLKAVMESCDDLSPSCI
jgi:hypothetical protein